MLDPNEFFRQMTLRICKTLHMQKALEAFSEGIQGIIPVTSTAIRVYNFDKNLIYTLAVVEEAANTNYYVKPLRISEQIKSWLLSAFDNADPVSIYNYPDPVLTELIKRYGLSTDISVMTMRLKIEGNRLGSLVLFVKGNDQYSPLHKQLLHLLHDPFAILLANALNHMEVLGIKDVLADDNQYLQNELRKISGGEVIGADRGLKNVMDMAHQVASTDSPVMLIGETGTGKDVIANAIHRLSYRKKKPFIRVNCGAIPENLIDSELFGHEKGAFTGAIDQKLGRFERANKGTIFLDEIGELPPQAQVRLLSAIQNREVERVGGNRPIPVDVRILSATHRDLPKMVAQQRFREDLWYRLNVFPIIIPPLRRRKEDIPYLVRYFIDDKVQELKLGIEPVLAPGAMDRLIAYDWPGNVRELQNIIERALIQHRDGYLDFANMSSAPSQPKFDVSQKATEAANIPTLDELNRTHIERVLTLTGGKINGNGGAASLLKIYPNTLRKRMNKLGIIHGRKRSSVAKKWDESDI